MAAHIEFTDFSYAMSFPRQLSLLSQSENKNIPLSSIDLLLERFR
jgi:hypothetical protein